jgi:iron complex outermembrane receptor protein
MQQFGKLFALETATFAKGRVILDFGASRNVARIQTNTPIVGSAIVNTSSPMVDIFKTLYQYGAVVKVLPDVSVFYGYNENFAPNVQNNQVLPSQSGKQNEVGVKTILLNKRLGLNLAYFDIKQVNLTAPAFPQTTPPSFVLISGENSKGIDGDISWEITKQIDVLGSFAFFNAEVPNTPSAIAAGNPEVLPVGNVSEKTFGLWGHYKFLGTLKGLSAGGGINYQSKKAITDSANTTFYGWVGGRTLVDLSFGYEIGKMKYTLNVENLFNTEYIYAARNQGLIIPAPGTNIKASVAYKF